MKWILIDKNKLPHQEVLAANFKPKTYGYKEKIIGYFQSYDETNDVISCENSNEVLDNCTHYIDIDSFDIEVK